ncbi:hypothetical protein [Colletotrichum higginsianum non-segmented dsRNA virus 1]|uniref:Uncharacterized protein n=1 Tax=Colletotrichum higginsianum non-segmented dsRNA virus 1 TaxID=1565088 RepID=A0A0N6W7G8_9VIRU|nr:hypothetical protein [Colletotrichum higginsianum non-segmented dsRNA virus 1]AIW81424.1 hypothetical protein [Colletotrichum higginsianum non-segmented dsRNA virus 1]
MSAPKPGASAEAKPVAGSLPAAGTPAVKGTQSKESPPAPAPLLGAVAEEQDFVSAPQTPPPLDPTRFTLSENYARLFCERNSRLAIGDIIRRWLLSKGITQGPATPASIYPPGWRVGRTPIPVEGGGVGVRTLDEVLPNLRAYDEVGNEVFVVQPEGNWTRVARLVAVWPAPVTIVAGMLSALQDTRVTTDRVLGLAQRSPEALEKLKAAGAEFKAHVQRFLDPVALRRSPEFVEVSQRYKRELRALIDEQQRAIREARAATRRVNQLLGERDQALARLDPAYVPKRATAAAALAQYGIDLGEEGEVAGLEESETADVLATLDF